MRSLVEHVPSGLMLDFAEPDFGGPERRCAATRCGLVDPMKPARSGHGSWALELDTLPLFLEHLCQVTTPAKEQRMTAWTRTIEIKQHLDLDKPLAEVRDPIAAILKADPAYQADPFGDFAEITDDMAEAPTVEDFNEMLSRLYDWADWNLVWIGGDPAYRRASA